MKIEEVKKIFKETTDKAGCAINCPITFNGRFKNINGRVSFTEDGQKVEKVEFSKRYFESEPDDKCRQIVLHECAHAIVTFRTHEQHDHDEIFRKVCAEIGCTLIGEYDEDNPASVHYNWEIRCSECGRIIRKYKRLPAKFNDINHFASACCNAPIVLKRL